MKRFDKSFIIMVIVLLQSCIKEKEVKITYYPDGKIHTIWYYKGDTLNGVKETYYNEGNLATKISFKNGVREGDFQRFYKNGFIAKRGTFRNNLVHGLFYEYFESDSGKLKTEAYMISDEGREFSYYWKKYDQAGRIVREHKALKIDTDFFSKIGESISGIIEYTDTVEYDSMKIVLDFTEQFATESKPQIDTFKFDANTAKVFFPSNSSDSIFSGKFLGYKTLIEGDSIIMSVDVGFFEEKLLLH